MAYEKKTWKNRQSEHPNRRTLTPVDGQENIYDVTRAEGLIMEEGDAFDQEEMNNLEERISNSFSELSSVTVTLPSSGWQGSQAPYTQTVAVEDYAVRLQELLESLKNRYGYNDLDAMLVLKDILAQVWKPQ